MLVGRLASAEDEVSPLEKRQLAVLVTDPEKDLVGLGGVNGLIPDRYPNDRNLEHSFVGSSDEDGPHPSCDRRPRAVQTELLEVIQTRRRHPVDQAVRSTLRGCRAHPARRL